MSIVSGSLGAVMGSNATEAAAETAATAQNNATDVQRQIYDQQRKDFEPFRQVGTNAIGDYEKMLSGGYDMKESPAAQYQLQQGTKSLNRQLAARGLLGSGNAAQRLSELSSGVAASDYQNQYNRLADALKLGTGASSAMSQASNQYGANVGNAAANLGNIAMQSGQARAGLYSGLGGASANTFGAGVRAYDYGKNAGWWGGSGGAAATNGAAAGGSYGVMAESAPAYEAAVF